MQQDAPTPLSYGSRFQTPTRFYPVVVLVMLAIVMIVWGCSWIVQLEGRCMTAGVYRHLELADGSLTFISSSGSPGQNYVTWASSPNLSYGRNPDWYKNGPPGQSHIYWRVHAAVTPVITSSIVIGIITALPARGSRRGIGRAR